MSKNAIIVSGPNGSGKTTFATEYLRSTDITEYISADAIAEQLVSTPEEFSRVRIQAGRLFFEKIQDIIEQVDHWNLFYNSEENYQEVAVGVENQFMVTNDALYQLFLKDIPMEVNNV